MKFEVMSKDKGIKLPTMADTIEVPLEMIDSLEEGNESVDEGAQDRNLMSILKDLSIKQQKQSATKRKANRTKSANAKVAKFTRDNISQIQQLTARRVKEKKVLLARAAKLREQLLQHESRIDEFSKHLYKRIGHHQEEIRQIKVPAPPRESEDKSDKALQRQEEVVRKEIRTKIVQLEEIMSQLSKKQSHEPSQFIMIR